MAAVLGGSNATQSFPLGVLMENASSVQQPQISEAPIHGRNGTELATVDVLSLVTRSLADESADVRARAERAQL
ncbi:hypothetical protein FGB62_158g08 [Gracilaria domingensis]|nr:hypothetical protein FGB62_158g08 [Gracilaria domingensis]